MAALRREKKAKNLIPLKKNSGPKDVRPIACGEVFRRVVEQVNLQKKHLPAVKPHLEPEQVGVGINDATTQTAIACSQLLPKIAQEPRLGLLQVDLKNAFNSRSGAAASATASASYVSVGQMVAG